jgi:exopolysaccharide biosynthesis polyprenyl glycosylphosphotransferase
LLSLSRLIKRWVWERRMRQGIGVDRVLIVGAGEVGRRLMRNIVAQPELGYQVIGFVDDDSKKNRTDIGRFKALGDIDNLPRVVQEEAIDEVIITLPWMHHRKILGIMRQCEREQVRARIVPDLFQLALSRVDIEDLGGIPIIGVKEVAITGWNLAFKRASDLVLSLAVLTFLSPLLLLISVAIKLDSPGPILFKQVRMGKGGRRFTCYKFRSMRQGAEEERPQLADRDEVVGPTFKIRHDPRCTRVGRLLRRTSLDELPQFYNVLRGEMSVVGPRPAIPAEVEQYQEWHRKRLEVSPGITGLWQVSGRSQLTFDEMCLLDIYYLENWSPLLDLKIALKTIPAALAGRGAY